MNKLYSLLVLITFSTFSFGQYHEPFNGTDALAGKNGWEKHSGTKDEVGIQYTLGSLNYMGLTGTSGNKVQIVAGKTEDVNKPIGADLDVAYASVLVNVLDSEGLTENNTTGDYFLCFSSGSGSSANSFQGRIYVKKGSKPNTINLGIQNTSNVTPTGQPTPPVTPTYSQDLEVNKVHYIVFKLDKTSKVASLWINPTPGMNETSTSLTNNSGTSNTFTATYKIKSLAIRQGVTGTFPNLIGQTGNIELDEIRVGSTWKEVNQVNLSTENLITKKVFVQQTVVKNTLQLLTNEEVTLEIFDTKGSLIKNFKTNQNEVDLSNLSAGNYVVKISSKTAKQNIKIVKL